MAVGGLLLLMFSPGAGRLHAPSAIKCVRLCVFEAGGGG